VNSSIKFHKNNGTQVFDGLFIKQEILMGALIDPVNPDIGVDQELLHYQVGRWLVEDLLELSFALDLSESAV
jgi:hypothetical protein